MPRASCLLLKEYARNGVLPQKPDCEVQGVVVHNLPQDSQEEFRSMICDCGDGGCCST